MQIEFRPNNLSYLLGNFETCLECRVAKEQGPCDEFQWAMGWAVEGIIGERLKVNYEPTLLPNKCKGPSYCDL